MLGILGRWQPCEAYVHGVEETPMLSTSITLAIFLAHPMPQTLVQDRYMQDTGADDFLVNVSPDF